MYHAWSPTNPDSEIPAAREYWNGSFRSRNDYFLEDGTYLRVRSLTFGYTFPLSKTKADVRNIRIYASASNPFTFTQYTGFDPEVGGNGLTNRGVDKGNYPIVMGVQLNL